MKAKLEYIDLSVDSSFTFREFKTLVFDAPYHFHPEYELTLVAAGRGTRFVGNHIGNFQPGDLVLVGANVAHSWLTDKNSISTKPKTPASTEDISHSVVIQFRDDFLGTSFFHRPELRRIAKLLEIAQAGICFAGTTAQQMAERMLQMKPLSEFYRLLQLLEILNTLSVSDEYTLLNNRKDMQQLSQVDCDRINRVYTFVMENFQREVELSEVAGLVSMTSTSFCRYFKKMTRKTFFQMITEYRIRHSMRLLSETNLSIAETCYRSGFASSSHFNQQFKAITQQTPLQYRKKIKKYV